MAALIRMTRYLRKERGVSLTGYGLLLGLLAIAAITAVTRIGTTVTELFGGVAGSLDNATSGSGGGNGGGEEEENPTPFLVTTLDDESCSPCTSLEDEAADGEGLSLREAIGLVNAGAVPSGSTIGFSVNGTITLSLGEMAIDGGNPVIDGTTQNITISGANTSRIFAIESDATIRNLTLSNGSATNGGAVLVQGGSVGLVSVDMTDNYASAYFGGGLFATGASTVVTINGGTISNNEASYGGGGFAATAGAEVSVYNASITGNDANAGGGVFIDGDPGSGTTVNIHDSAIDANTATAIGGGIGIGGYDIFMNLYTTTVDGNSTAYGGGIVATGEDITITLNDNTSVTNNTASVVIGGIWADGSGVTVLGDTTTTISGNSAPETYETSGATITILPTLAAFILTGAAVLASLPAGLV